MTRRLLAAAVAVLVAACSPACGRDEPRVLTIPIDGRPSAVTSGGGLVWVADDEHHVVHVIDPDDGKVTGSVEVERNPIALTSGGGYVWVAHASGVVVPIEIATRRPRDAIEAGTSLTGTTFLDGRVWATDLPNDRIVGIDASRLRVARRIDVPDGAVRVAAASDHLWVTGQERTVTRIDPRSREVGEPVAVGSGPIGLAYDGERVWVANSDDGTVTAVDAGTGDVDRTVQAGRGPVAVAVDRSGSVWVANQDDSALVRDPGGDAETIAIGINPRDLAVGGGFVWAAGNSSVPNSNAVVRVLP